MTGKDIIRKISSRKFWACIVEFVTSVLIAFNMENNEIAQVSAIITAFGSIVIYILSEAYVDAAKKEDNE